MLKVSFVLCRNWLNRLGQKAFHLDQVLCQLPVICVLYGLRYDTEPFEKLQHGYCGFKGMYVVSALDDRRAQLGNIME